MCIISFSVLDFMYRGYPRHCFKHLDRSKTPPEKRWYCESCSKKDERLEDFKEGKYLESR